MHRHGIHYPNEACRSVAIPAYLNLGLDIWLANSNVSLEHSSQPDIIQALVLRSPQNPLNVIRDSEGRSHLRRW